MQKNESHVTSNVKPCRHGVAHPSREVHITFALPEDAYWGLRRQSAYQNKPIKTLMHELVNGFLQEHHEPTSEIKRPLIGRPRYRPITADALAPSAAPSLTAAKPAGPGG